MGVKSGRLVTSSPIPVFADRDTYGSFTISDLPRPEELEDYDLDIW
jgi:hypothetical protein